MLFFVLSCYCRLQAADQVTKYLDAAPKKELENILQLVCNIFKVDNALIALFGDRRIYIINTVGGFKVGMHPSALFAAVAALLLLLLLLSCSECSECSSCMAYTSLFICFCMRGSS